jgi:hypothetical protein
MEMPATRSPTSPELLHEILVVIDKFFKQTVLIPTKKTATTDEIFHLLRERVFAIYGIPESITSDRDKTFRTEKWMAKVDERDRMMDQRKS